MFMAAQPGPNFITQGVQVQSDLNIPAWNNYANIVNELDSTLIKQLQFGFCMGVQRDRFISVPPTNHASARVEYSAIDQFIIKHWENKAILGPFRVNPLPVPVFPSPLQVVVTETKKRPVVDMSFPNGTSVNDAIPCEWTEIPGFSGVFSLPTHDDVCNKILSTPDPLMFVVDLAAYYLQLPIDPCDFPYMAISWRDNLYFYARLPFGCRSACLHAQRVSDAVVKIHTTLTRAKMDAYVDDFMAILTRLLAMGNYEKFRLLLKFLGLIATLEKCKIPASFQLYLGLQYDLVNLTLALPQEKVEKALNMISEWLIKETCSKSDLQSLLGNLNHFSSVVHAGRPFCAAIMDALRQDQFPAILTDDFKFDLRMWGEFLGEGQVKSIMKSASMSAPDSILTIAVSGRCCVVKDRDQIHGFRLHISQPDLPSPAMYILATCCATQYCMPSMENKLVLVNVPRKYAANAINRANVHSPEIRPLMRHSWLKQAKNDCVIKAAYNPDINKTSLFALVKSFMDVDLTV